MKKLNLFLIIISVPLLLNAQPLFKIGTLLGEAKKNTKYNTYSVYQNTVTLAVPDTLYGLADEWGYRFTNDTLDWIFFHEYVNDLSADNFNKCLSTTKNLIKDFSSSYGAPDSLIVGDTLFKDPYKQHHYGYDVLEAQWKNADGMKMDIEFTFFGGKGEYHLIVTINMFDNKYPYFH